MLLLAGEGFRLGTSLTCRALTHFLPKAIPRSVQSSLDWLATSCVAWISSWPQNLHGWLSSVEPSAAFADHGRTKDVLHSTRFVLIDRLVQIRGYYDSREEAALQRLRTSPDPSGRLSHARPGRPPSRKCDLNATSAILLASEYRFIRRRQIADTNAACSPPARRRHCF